MSKNDERKALKDDELESASGGTASFDAPWISGGYDPRVANKSGAFDPHGEEISPAHRLHLDEIKKK